MAPLGNSHLSNNNQQLLIQIPLCLSEHSNGPSIKANFTPIGWKENGTWSNNNSVRKFAQHHTIRKGGISRVYWIVPPQRYCVEDLWKTWEQNYFYFPFSFTFSKDDYKQLKMIWMDWNICGVHVPTFANVLQRERTYSPFSNTVVSFIALCTPSLLRTLKLCAIFFLSFVNWVLAWTMLVSWYLLTGLSDIKDK